MPNKQPHILHLASWYPGRQDALLGNFIQRHAEVIATRCPSALLYAEPAQQPGVEVTQRGALREVRVYFEKKRPWLSYRKALYRGLGALKEEGFSPDLLHLHVAYPAGLWALEQKLPLVITEHHTGYHRPEDWSQAKRWLRQRILNKARVICPVSKHLGMALRDFGAHTRQQVIGNVVDTALFHPPKAAPSGNKKRLLHLSTLVDERKNIRGLLRAVTALYRHRPEFELWIGGDGDLQALQKWISETDLPPEAVKTFGPQQAESVAQMMRECDGFVLFSHTENQPVVLLEAMSSGLPIISSDVAGIPEYVDEEAGQLVAAGDEAALTEALAHWLDEPPGPRKAHSQIGALASERAISDSFAALYEKVLSGSKG